MTNNQKVRVEEFLRYVANEADVLANEIDPNAEESGLSTVCGRLDAIRNHADKALRLKALRHA